MELYSNPLCPYAHRVRLALAEKGVVATQIDIDLRNRPASFATLSPRGTVPVLKVGQQVLWDSAVIAEYLEDAYPRPALLPLDPVQRAQARSWIRFADECLYANTSRLLHSSDEVVRAEALARIREDLRFMEAQAFTRPENAGPFWLGEQFTLVDATIYPWFEQRAALTRFRDFTWPEDCRRLTSWQAAVAARPCVRAQRKPQTYYLRAYAAMQGIMDFDRI